jgi:hypothetical protein
MSSRANGQVYPDYIFNGISGIMIGRNREATRHSLRVLEVATQGCPLEVYASRFIDSRLFSKILNSVVDADVDPNL